MLKRINVLMSILAVLALVSSCRRKVEERPIFSSAEYFSPTVVAPSSQFVIYGDVLNSSEVYLGSQKATIDSVSADGSRLYVHVPNDLEVGSEYTVRVVYSETEDFEFIAKIRVGATSSTVKELLIGDFDGGGIRSAIATSNFTNGQWSGNAGANSIIGVGSNVNGVESSPKGGNFAFGTVHGGGVLPNTYGFVATISSRAGLQNDLVSEWPNNFFEYPKSVLDSSDKVINNYFINFYLNFNNNQESQVRVYIGNTKIPKGDRFARTIRPVGAANPVDGWYKVSISLNNFRSGFGFNDAMTFEDFLKMNQVDFDIADRFNNNYSSNVTGPNKDCCRELANGSFVNECCATAIKDPVQVYFDHVVISQGGPTPDIQ